MEMSMYGNPLKTMKIDSNLEEKYEPEPNSGCWLWTASVDRVGYGHIWLDGKLKQSHRFMWELFNGSIPHGMKILHKCDVRSCVNPNHLFLGTQKENMQDCKKKGRIRFLQKKCKITL